ncbi:hypothetical protein, unlikely [Trypanosoma congolense IL3000]|uniref:EIPR1-like beta-propeller domain-containing protein n=1 Tax=Trypanosoma congolense (strain IL3000) TaxID=1068625 RepID=F9WJH3_TRYCI|nr:hypothetical protein, unlikely [Trypanosoma congolense IL3000]
MMTAAVYGLELQACAISPLYYPFNSDSGTHRFLVGTSCFADENVIRLLTFQEETRVLECSAQWLYGGEEVLGLWCSPSIATPSLLAVATPTRCSVLRLPDVLTDELQRVVDFDVARGKVVWDLEGLQHEVNEDEAYVSST